MADNAANPLSAQKENEDKVAPSLPDEPDLTEVENTVLDIEHKQPKVSDQSSPPEAPLRANTPSSGSEHFRTGLKERLRECGWDRDVDSSTTSSQILETLTASSYALGHGRRDGQLRINAEREPILIFEKLHLADIQRVQVRLLDISRGYADPPITDFEEIHRLLYQYRTSSLSGVALQTQTNPWKEKLWMTTNALGTRTSALF